MNRIMRSLKNINGRMFLALLIMGLCPTLYTTLRTFFLGQLPGEWSFSIAGQLSWVNLLYEVINEAIILPLYFFMGQAVSDKEEYSNRIRSGFLISLGIYTACSVLVMIFVDPLLRFMAVSQDILSESASYIRIECIANIFGILYSFICVALITIGKDKLVYAITAAKLILSIILDTLLVSSLPVSMKCGVNGIGISNIISNLLLFIIAAVLISRCGYPIFEKKKLSFAWMKDFFKIGSISGLESFVRNIAYMLMVSRMVNMVGEQGTYWVANNFIWGWMLLPITQLGELIKQETAKDKNAVRNNTPGYFAVTAMTCLLWVVTIPLYKPFMKYVLNYSDVDKLFKLVMVLFVFYVLYAFQNVFDATFYGRGKTKYMLFESVVTNTIYYGAFFILYLCGIWKPTLIGIALMFGFGNAFDTVVSYLAYRHFLKKENISIGLKNE
ncbi:MATE family Na+-driven efflux transporter [Ruminococcus flavefaciens]|uniref:MATE family Na+-driven efflux transporter n=1 Tax=Ruminococcus flavefaciens TaxID=1265 RepID=UPI0026ECF160|nr:MATE family Na+-driven efflux transporter [Ruminococcus flavefaciens]